MELVPWHRRNRWSNEARLAIALAADGLVAAWPRLTPSPPAVPAVTPRPLGCDAGAPAHDATAAALKRGGRVGRGGGAQRRPRMERRGPAERRGRTTRRGVATRRVRARREAGPQAGASRDAAPAAPSAAGPGRPRGTPPAPVRSPRPVPTRSPAPTPRPAPARSPATPAPAPNPPKEFVFG